MDLKEKLISFYIKQENQYKISDYYNAYLRNLRQKSIDFFKRNGFPNKKEKDWKYIDIKNVIKHDYNVLSKRILNINEKKISKYFYISDLYKIVFIDGIYNANLSTIDNNIYYSLSEIFNNKKYEKIIENYYGKISSNYINSLISINNAIVKDGVFILIPKNSYLTKPIHILYISTGYTSDHMMLNPRNLIIIGKGSKVKIIESYQSIKDHVVFNNSVSEIYLEKNSEVKYCKIQNDREKTSLIDHTIVSQEENSKFFIDTFSFQGHFIKNTLNIIQLGEGIKSYLKGLTVTNNNEEQLIDNHTMIEHLNPNCNSHEIYKSILNGKSRFIFNGKIKVNKNAQKINAFQKNNNILLSKEASINSNPQLEIFADDVKCSHGCTIGYINKEALFYLCSRGISKKNAKYLLLLSFINEIINDINIPELKEYFNNIVKSKLTIYK